MSATSKLLLPIVILPAFLSSGFTNSYTEPLVGKVLMRMVLRVLRPSRRIAIFFNRVQIDPQASISTAVPLLPTRGTVQPRIRLASTAQKLFWRHWGFANG